jgi:hypothetical protein
MQNCLVPVLLLSSFAVSSARADVIPVTGIDFGDQPGMLYVPAKKMAHLFGLDMQQKHRQIFLAGKPLKHRRQLFDGTDVVAVRDLEAVGLKMGWEPASQTVTLDSKDRQVTVHAGTKRAMVNKASQQLRAYQGDVLVLETHVSTGRRGHGTPSGDFEAARKERIHYSSLYDDSPMPYAVQVHGNIFVHGFTSVPSRPASHGCIRMPLYGRNAARWFYQWVTIGTPVTVANGWPSEKVALSSVAPR